MPTPHRAAVAAGAALVVLAATVPATAAPPPADPARATTTAAADARLAPASAAARAARGAAARTPWTPGAARADGPTCTKGLIIEHDRTKRYLAVETGYPGPAKGMLRATVADPGPKQHFEICITSAKDPGTLRAYLRSAAARRFVSAEPELPGRRAGMVRAGAAALSANTQFLLYLQGKGRVYLRANANNRFVTVERNYPGGDDEMARAGRDARGAGELFTVYTADR
ncbi:hypothetical protein GCM10010123_22130 [Pilimelia anulata]|uniref:Uncharacterized protein n=1 Tax=Pilimelia anulata TaxID=53371 RepID=A0A8J3B5V7_9ACTN|nr:hypothetical protein [Pilimelia anulata]GGJ91891.1 hypothetical protein GCM10010123_22130 [Pilimelia anulata]